MGNKLFGVDIAQIIHQAVSNNVLKGKLKQYKDGARVAGELTDGNHPTGKTYNFRGILDEFSQDEIDGQRILASDRKLLIIGNSLPRGIVPGGGDDAEMEGTPYKVVTLIARDPAAATYVLQVR